MLSLSPAKLLVILVIALIVLGPEKLPQVARQIGAAWHDMRRWRARVEDEVRGTFPNLPPTHEVAQAVRSPLAFLDRLADEHEKAQTEELGPTADPDGTSDPEGTGGGDPPAPAASNGSAPANGSGPPLGSVAPGGSHGGAAGRDDPAPRRIPAGPGAFPTVPDDPSMN
jgi:sec-independent protein translocase protein TatB